MILSVFRTQQYLYEFMFYVLESQNQPYRDVLLCACQYWADRIKQEGPWALGRLHENDWSVEWNHLWNFGRGHHEEQFCEIILNLGQWFRRRCPLKGFFSGALAVLLFGGAEPFMQIWKRAWGTFMWSYMKFGPVVQKEMSFKDISYLERWQPLCSADWNHLCNFGWRYHEEQFWKIIWNLDQGSVVFDFLLIVTPIVGVCNLFYVLLYVTFCPF